MSETLSARLRARRLELDMTQEAVAAAVGVGLRVYQRWEAGSTRPRGDNYERVIAALGLDVEGGDAARPVALELAAIREEITRLGVRLGGVEEQLQAGAAALVAIVDTLQAQLSEEARAALVASTRPRRVAQ